MSDFIKDDRVLADLHVRLHEEPGFIKKALYATLEEMKELFPKDDLSSNILKAACMLSFPFAGKAELSTKEIEENSDLILNIVQASSNN